MSFNNMRYYHELIYRSRIRQFGLWLESNYGIEWNELGRAWWNFATGDRVVIARRVNESYLNLNITRVRDNKSAPWLESACVSAAIVKCCIAGDMTEQEILKPAQYEHNGFIKQHVSDVYGRGLKLPVYLVSLVKKDMNHHAMNAVLIQPDYSELLSWVFFQRNDFDIPADGNDVDIPRGTRLQIFNRSSAVAQYTKGSIVPRGKLQGKDTILQEFFVPEK